MWKTRFTTNRPSALSLERVSAAVAWDVKNDKVSLEAAREQYGVILNEQTLEVDEAATRTVRREMRSRR